MEEVPTETNIFNSPESAHRQPVEDPSFDSVNVAKIVFDEKGGVYEFGKVKEGDKVRHTFEFTNEGTQPLVISNAFSTCGCTVPEYSKEPVPVGGRGKIDVLFNTDGKVGEQEKVVYINGNTWPAQSTATLRGSVRQNTN